MEAEVIRQEQPTSYVFSKHVPFPYAERLVLGTIAGATSGLLAGVIVMRTEGEAGAFLGLLLAPFFAIVGACCGVVSKRSGWAKVRPLAWAMLGGILYIDNSIAWVLGGTTGGVINGILSRSIRKTMKGVLAGTVAGLLGWAIVWAYLFVFWFVLGGD
jgi:hypothetical protein